MFLTSTRSERNEDFSLLHVAPSQDAAYSKAEFKDRVLRLNEAKGKGDVEFFLDETPMYARVKVSSDEFESICNQLKDRWRLRRTYMHEHV